MTSLPQRIIELGYQLPDSPMPLASYVPAKICGDMIFISGQLPFKDKALLMEGQMTMQRDLEQAKQAMAQCFLNGLAAVATVTDLNELRGVLRLGAYVASSTDFTNQHIVANGASDLAKALFESKGLHTRFAIGVAALPLGATVELELIFYR